MKLSKRTYLLLGIPLLLALAVGAAAIRTSGSSLTVPQDTLLQVRVDRAFASDQSRSGDTFDATIVEPVSVEGKIAIPAGARAKGIVENARESGRLSGVARLQLTLTSVEVDGKSYDVHTTAVGRSGHSHRNRNLAWIGGGAGAGALLGGLAGGGKGALIGAPLGAGAGTAVAAITGKKDVRIPAEARLTFRLSQPVSIRVKT